MVEDGGTPRRGQRRRPLVASALAGCTGGPGGSVEAEVHLGFEQYTLGNGLKVILREEHRLPIAAVNLWYHVGPANGVKGRMGSPTCSST